MCVYMHIAHRTEPNRTFNKQMLEFNKRICETERKKNQTKKKTIKIRAPSHLSYNNQHFYVPYAPRLFATKWSQFQSKY